MSAPANERELLAALAGVFSLADLYARIEAADLTARDHGEDVVHGVTDTRWRRRARGALQTLRRQGRARRGAGECVWVLDGRPEAPRGAILVSLSGRVVDVELRLQRAADLLADLDEPPHLILADTPYALGVGTGARTDTGERIYARDGSRVVAGYVDVPPERYRAFTTEWVSAAAVALRPGGYLAVVTGPQQAAWVQVTAEDAGLTWVNSLAVGKVFPVRTSRRFSQSHWTVTLMCRGRLDSARRFFTTPDDLPKSAKGTDYPQDFWAVGEVGRADAAPGAVRYANSLPWRLVDRLVVALTRNPVPDRIPDLVVDPFVGGGTTGEVAVRRGRRFIGGDVNARALAFTAQRLSRVLLAPGETATPPGRTPASPGQMALSW